MFKKKKTGKSNDFRHSPETDSQQYVPKQRLDDDTRPDCAHNGPVEPYETGGMPPGGRPAYTLHDAPQ